MRRARARAEGGRLRQGYGKGSTARSHKEGGHRCMEIIRITCGARTRAGHPCRRKGTGKGRRCRNHGGKSTGPRTIEGRERIANAQRARWQRWRLYNARYCPNCQETRASAPQNVRDHQANRPAICPKAHAAGPTRSREPTSHMQLMRENPEMRDNPRRQQNYMTRRRWSR